MIDFLIFKRIKDALFKEKEKRLVQEISKYIHTDMEDSGKQLEKILIDPKSIPPKKKRSRSHDETDLPENSEDS